MSASTTRATSRSSECACSASIGFPAIARCDKSARVLRVSSAATRATARSVSAARALTSPRLPIGVATT
jgi:hypothetical protein